MALTPKCSTLRRQPEPFVPVTLLTPDQRMFNSYYACSTLKRMRHVSPAWRCKLLFFDSNRQNQQVDRNNERPKFCSKSSKQIIKTQASDSDAMQAHAGTDML